MGKEIILNTAHHFNWVNIGAAIKHAEEGRILDLSGEINKEVGISDSYVRIIPSSGYGNPDLLRQLLRLEKPDAVMIFTDPRYWVWLFEIEREIRSKIPLIFLNIWDSTPAPMYNKSYYDSCDALMAISKQTKNINQMVLGERAKEKVIEYVPHGINSKYFYPIRKEHSDYLKLQDFRSKILGGKDIDFIVFFNSRNIRRKSIPDSILAYKLFCDMIGKEKAKKCAFVLHTNAIDENGTDLLAVREAFCDPEYVNVFFSESKLQTQQMNLLYNMSDVTLLLSSNEGWGLALTESMMTGTMIIANVSGGMQDQMRFTKDGKWIDFSSDFPSNHRGTVKDHGEWAVPVYPSNISVVGSPQTPYIFDDRCSFEDAANAILEVYSLSKEERDRRGMSGYDWACGEEANMTAEAMGRNVIEVIDKTLESFKPRAAFDLIKIENLSQNYVPHKLIY